MSNNNRRNRKQIKKKSREPVQSALPGMNAQPSAYDESAAGLFPFPGADNERIDSMLDGSKSRMVQFFLELCSRKYLAAETIIGIDTALGYQIRNCRAQDLNRLALVYSFMTGWFKCYHQNELHPLFPFVLEELGFKSDEERILLLWQQFYREKLQLLLKISPKIILLAVKTVFSENETARHLSAQVMVNSLHALVETLSKDNLLSKHKKPTGE